MHLMHVRIAVSLYYTDHDRSGAQFGDSMAGFDWLTQNDVQDYVDERASPDVVQAIEDAMDEDWQIAQLVAAYREQVANMHRAFGRGTDIPDRLHDVLRKATRRTP